MLAVPSTLSHSTSGVLSLCLLLAASTGCKPADSPADDGESSTGGETEGSDPDALTWWRDIEPIVRQKCAVCHSPGNIAPFSLETHQEFVAWSELAAAAIETGQMPPWLAAPDCNDYANSLALSLEQQEALLSYAAGDMPEGDPADAPPDGPAPPELVPDVVLDMPEPYAPQQTPDDYRCFLIPWPAEYGEDMFVTGLEIYPGETAIVHHVITFVADQANAQSFADLDAADPGPGYTCFGGPGGGPGQARWLGAWVPGQRPFFAPEGVGQRISPDSTLIMQVHYNSSPGDGYEDRSALALELSPSVDRLAVVAPITDTAWLASNGAMMIPAGDANATHETLAGHDHLIVNALKTNELGLGPNDALEIGDVGMHMHLFGKAGRVEVRHGGGGSTECLLDIPAWDFNWQMSHELVQPVSYGPDDEIHLQCWWDNSAENQPIVDGQQLEPADLDWGDGTLDEMCLGILYLTAAP